MLRATRRRQTLCAAAGRRSAKLTGIASGGTDWRNITVVSQQGSPLKSLRHRTADKTPDHKVGAPGHLCCGIVPSGFYAFSEAMSRGKKHGHRVFPDRGCPTWREQERLMRDRVKQARTNPRDKGWLAPACQSHYLTLWDVPVHSGCNDNPRKPRDKRF